MDCGRGAVSASGRRNQGDGGAAAHRAVQGLSVCRAGTVDGEAGGGVADCVAAVKATRRRGLATSSGKNLN